MLKDFDTLLQLMMGKPPRIVVVAAAHDNDILQTARQATAYGIATFILVGDETQITAMMEEHGDIPGCRILHEPDDAKASARAVALINSGEADLPMKGLLSTATFLRAVLDKQTGLRGERILSETTIIEKDNGGLLLITDCAMNIDPDLAAKKAIIQNAVELAHKLGCETPKVACITALEQVNSQMQDTLDAAALSKMNERGQISGCVIDGPFALDNAISQDAADHKGVISPVAGRADILLMSDIRMGNVLHKAITYIANKRVACTVMGARLPVIITSRSDSPETKLLSIALACTVYP